MTIKVEEWVLVADKKLQPQFQKEKHMVEQATSSPVSSKATCLLTRPIIQGEVLSPKEQGVLY